jgi:hypothetical protein
MEKAEKVWDDGVELETVRLPVADSLPDVTLDCEEDWGGQGSDTGVEKGDEDPEVEEPNELLPEELLPNELLPNELLPDELLPKLEPPKELAPNAGLDEALLAVFCDPVVELSAVAALSAPCWPGAAQPGRGKPNAAA